MDTHTIMANDGNYVSPSDAMGVLYSNGLFGKLFYDLAQGRGASIERLNVGSSRRIIAEQLFFRQSSVQGQVGTTREISLGSLRSPGVRKGGGLVRMSVLLNRRAVRGCLVIVRKFNRDGTVRVICLRGKMYTGADRWKDFLHFNCGYTFLILYLVY